MVWTRSGPYIYFDSDNGFPSPGFRLGFPTVQMKVFDAQTARNAYLLITGSGKRVELRQVGTSNIYEAADSSYLRLTETGGNLLVYSIDGTKLTLTYSNNEYRCTEVKDRNGNYITINYNSLGRLTSITDTLGRLITFNYDTNDNLLSITQAWNGQPSHQWVSFGWALRNMQSSFSPTLLQGVIAPKNGTALPVITQVNLNDTSSVTFDYTNSLQVSLIRKDFGVIDLNATTFTYETPAGDAPRLTDSRVSARNWTGVNGLPAEVIATYNAATDRSWAQLTAPDGTIYKELFATSGWQTGLTTGTEIWSAGVKQKWTTTAWTQDDTAVSHQKNPRAYDVNIYDEAGNRRRTETIYTSFNLPSPVALPTEVKEYAADASTVLRRTTTTYFTSQPYIDRRVLGLVRESMVYDGNNNPQSRVWYDYDWSNDAWAATPQPATQHESSSDPAGRGNLCWIGRWDVTDLNNPDKVTRSYIKYNRTGSVIRTEDHYGHGTSISYADSFSDTVNRNTFAYPTTITDADQFSSYAQYNYDFGATTRTESPAPANQPQGAIQTMSYNPLGQLERITTTNNGAYKRFWYGGDYVASLATVNNVADELYSVEAVDGLGRIMRVAGDHPGSYGGYWHVTTIYDQMGRAWKVSNPTEVNGAWQPSGDDAAGMYYTQQTYDWKGRPLVTTNPNNTTKEASYSGCGCAGGEVVTLTDEGTIDGGIAKRRQQKIYSDVLGRTVKTEVLNWQGGSVYSSTVNTYNARDQIEQIRQYAGPEGSGTYQDTIITYDGLGRLKTKRVPEQGPGTATVWTYNSDDTIATITDARGAITTFDYTGTNRHLVKTLTHTLTGSSTISVSYDYDAASNRTSMTDSLGSVAYQYDQLSRLTSETRTFTNLFGSFPLTYSYNLQNQLMSITDPFGASFSYTRDSRGRLKTITGSSYAGFTNYVNDVSYRAWGAPKSVAYTGSNSTIGFNTRLQPNEFRLTANGTGTSIMREDYSYFADGRLRLLTDLDDTPGTNPPATLRFLSRNYSYDQVGRPTGGQGTGSGSMPGVPYSQSYSYDQFGNMTGRSGSYYNYTLSPPATDSATYNNNRRSNWTYNAEGQVTATPSTSTDAPRTMMYDAAGRMISSVQSGQSSTVTYSATYDGDGRLVYEISTTSLGSSSASYIVRSTVLGGEVLTRLDQSGNKLITHVPAEGLLFATQMSSGGPGPFVMITNRNPLGISETTKAVYDPLGNYIPFQANGDPRPPAGSYNSGSMSGLVSSQTDANSYSVGCVSDGVPTNCNSVMQAINRDQASKLGILGLAVTPALMRVMASFTAVGAELRPGVGAQSPPQQPSPLQPASRTAYTINIGISEVWTQFIIAPGLQQAFEQNPQNTSTQKPMDTTQTEKMLTEDCLTFLNSILAQLKDPHSKNLLDILKAAKGRLFTRNLSDEEKKKRLGGTHSRVGDPAFYIYLGEAEYANDPYLLIHELFHGAAGTGTGYTHFAMATAAYKVALADPTFMKYANRHGGLREPKPPDYSPDSKDPEDWYNADVFDRIARHGCTHPIDWNW